MTTSEASKSVTTMYQIIEIFVPVSPGLLKCLAYFDEHIQFPFVREVLIVFTMHLLLWMEQLITRFSLKNK